MILTTVIVLAVIGAVGAFILFTAAKKFEVHEDPRIGKVAEILPQANCGGCGYPGCGGFATACVKADSLDGLYCPVGGADVMSQVAEILGMAVSAQDPMVAVLRCNGDCDARPRTNVYDGASSCAVAASLYSGDTNCAYGCLGLGDCVNVCNFGALHINPVTRLPEVDEELCTACGACVKACPKILFELRKKGPKSRRIFVSCMNKDKGAMARKACSNACIGCSLCQKQCAFEAITVENNLAYIDYTKCRLCRKCVEVCPTKAIHELNFPPRKKAEDTAAVAKTAAPKTEVKEPESNREEAPKSNQE